MNRDISKGLRTTGLFGRKPVIGFVMFFLGILIFIALAFNLVYNGPLIRLDLSVNNYFHAFALNSPAFLTSIMIAGYYIGLYGIILVAALLGLYFLYKRFWKELVMVALSVGVGGLLFTVLSHTFMRPRPFTLFDKLVWAGSPNIPGFPSGHTLNIVILCGLFIYLFVPKLKSRLGKTLVITIALLVILYIGVSRLYVGDHYLTDVLAGYAVGIAWFGISCTFVELIFQKKEGEKT